MNTNIIELKGVSKYYHDHPVLQDIHLEVKNREFLTILGPSGCGKTTLLRLISGFETPSNGSILMNGKDVSNLPPHLRHVNTVFQSYALFPHLNVFDNVAFGLRCKHLPKEEIVHRVTEALRMVKLIDLATRKPHQLSGGQQQRIAIARAVVNQPMVLLLDEPLSSLDYRLRKTMQMELKQLQAQLGITFILVTHDQEEALSTADRVVVMNHGLIEQVGTPREVYEEPRNLHVAQFVGEVNIFKTTVHRADSEFIEVEIEEKKFKLKNTKNFTADQTLYTLLRPEDLEVWGLNEVQEPENMYSALVQQVIYKGSTVDLILKLKTGTQILTTQFFNEDDEKLDFRPGESVWVYWHTGWEVILADEA
ncbi:MAG TPA: spermidine/putrescine ABC transporter ATP-binding protein PotA [Gammaproteobacteria bacterium]|nr:spermidine/putrescine ABC transporter ATP-binding protein PotA [Gammaproteobacteria bacterium]HRA42187.1 spermidine/putrescine ABC transporter ATP-binding protein PotA [Gammaproteobacteria bacterium]